MKPLRVVVAGGRNFDDYGMLSAAMAEALGDRPLDQVRVVSGGARGADLLGERWAKEHGVPVDRYDADWDNVNVPGAVVATNRNGKPYNKAAGMQRNAVMADNADAVLVLPGGAGTANMAKLASDRGLTLHDYRQRVPAPMPEQPAAVVNPTGQQVADGVQLQLDLEAQQVQEDPQRKAGDLMPWLLAAGAGGLLGYGASQLME